MATKARFSDRTTDTADAYKAGGHSTISTAGIKPMHVIPDTNDPKVKTEKMTLKWVTEGK